MRSRRARDSILAPDEPPQVVQLLEEAFRSGSAALRDSRSCCGMPTSTILGVDDEIPSLVMVDGGEIAGFLDSRALRTVLGSTRVASQSQREQQVTITESANQAVERTWVAAEGRPLALQADLAGHESYW
jgi:hypothetical protein